MTRNIPLFSYRPIRTPIHRIPGIIKLATMLVLDIAIFSCASPILVVITVFLGITAIIARLRLAVILKNLRLLVSFGIFIVLFKIPFGTLDTEALRDGLTDTALYLWQLAAVLYTGSLFYETTSSLEIHHALSSIQNLIFTVFRRLIRKKTHFPDIALLLSLTIHFIPRIFISWNVLNDAWDARGGNRTKGLRVYIRRLTHLVPLLIAKLLSVAIDTDLAIKNRTS